MESNIQHAQTKMQMNVSKEGNAEFMRLLESEDPERYANLMRNIRRDNPDVRMSEDQALTNFMLGLPTGQWRFAVVAGKDSIHLQLVTLPSVRCAAYVRTASVRICANTSSSHHPLPQGARSNARYCDRACQQAAYRHRTAA
jgi:hypothetical protein